MHRKCDRHLLESALLASSAMGTAAADVELFKASSVLEDGLSLRGANAIVDRLNDMGLLDQSFQSRDSFIDAVQAKVLSSPAGEALYPLEEGDVENMNEYSHDE